MQLSRPTELVKRAFALFFSSKNFLSYVMIGFVPHGIYLGLLAASPLIFPRFYPLLAPLFSGGRAEIGTLLILASVLVIFGFAIAFIGSFYSATLFRFHFSVASELPDQLGVIVRRGWESAGHLLVVSVLRGLVILGGFLLFLIPGILFALWFTFVPIIAAVEAQDVDAFRMSKDLVTSRLWPVVGRLVLFSLLYILPQSILMKISPIAGSLWFLSVPFYSLLMMLLYLDVKRAYARV